jgi:hypothetical protein
MSGVLPLLLLASIIIMCLSSMILASSPGFIYCNISLSCSKKFHDFQAHVERLFDRKVLAMQTDWGDEYHKLHNFLSASSYPIMSHVHAHISRMALLNASITTLLRQV